jgi:hypothetical protein
MRGSHILTSPEYRQHDNEHNEPADNDDRLFVFFEKLRGFTLKVFHLFLLVVSALGAAPNG